MVPGCPPCTEEVDVLLWLLPPGVTSERMRISAASSHVPPFSFHRSFVSSSRLGPRSEGHGPVFPRCARVVRMEGRGCGLPEGLDNSRGRRRPAAAWLLTSCGVDEGVGGGAA